MEKPSEQTPVAVFGDIYLHPSWKLSSTASLPSIKAQVEKYKQKTGLGFNRMFGMNKEKKFLGIDILRGFLCYANSDVELMGKIGSFKEIPFDTFYSIATDLSKPGKYKLEIRTSKREYCFKFFILGDWVEFLERLKYLYSKKDHQPLFPMTQEYLTIAISVKGTSAEKDATAKAQAQAIATTKITGKDADLEIPQKPVGAQPAQVPARVANPPANPTQGIVSKAGKEELGVQKSGVKSGGTGQREGVALSPRDPETKEVRVRSKEKAAEKAAHTDESSEEGEGGHRGEQPKAVNEIVKQRKNV